MLSARCSWRFRVLVAGLLHACVVGCAWAAPRTDVIVLVNGDRITGEVKKLERGLLTLKTDALGTVEIEWPKIARIQTRQLLEIEGLDRTRHVGRLVDSGDGELLMEMDGGHPLAPVPMESVVSITPLVEGGWLDRVKGSATVGFNAASANEDREVTLSADVSYRDETQSFDVSYSGGRTKSANNPGLERQSAEAMYRWSPAETYFWAATAKVASNDELQLELRTIAGGGVGYYWLRDTQRELWGLVGLIASRERYRGEASQESVEAVLQGKFDLFHFSDPDIDLSSTIALYPSLTIPGRIRSEWSLTARIELIKDLFHELSWQRSMDNKPPGGEGHRNDWSVTTSLGYKF